MSALASLSGTNPDPGWLNLVSPKSSLLLQQTKGSVKIVLLEFDYKKQGQGPKQRSVLGSNLFSSNRLMHAIFDKRNKTFSV